MDEDEQEGGGPGGRGEVRLEGRQRGKRGALLLLLSYSFVLFSLSVL
jgi:hypothetical protein